METIENNILIAEFDQKYSEGFGLYDFNGCHYKLDELEFHTCWNWLMPVISKITKDERYIGNEYRESIMDVTPYGNKEDSYKSVVEFIKWYNKQN